MVVMKQDTNEEMSHMGNSKNRNKNHAKRKNNKNNGPKVKRFKVYNINDINGEMNEPDGNKDSMSVQTEKRQKIDIQTALGILSLVVSIVGFIYTAGYKIGGVEERLSNMDKRLATVETEVDEINKGLRGDPAKGIKGLYTNVELLQDKVNKLETNWEDASKIILQTSGNSGVINTPDITNNNNSILTAYNPDDAIGTDTAGNTYTAESLKGKRVLLDFTVNNKQNYFLGQLSDSYYWDGDCIINTYNSDGTLFGVTEYNIKGHHILSYKSFYMDDEEVDRWIFTDREVTENGNSGISIKYSLKYDKKRDFTNESASAMNILCTADLISLQNIKMDSYYSGLTSNTKYNDTSGNAYEVIYNDAGYVKTLYIGKFRDGKFIDDSGNAREIVYDGKKYLYYKGIFNSKGERAGKVSGSNYVTQEQIDEIIAGIDFGCPLNWIITN